MAEISLAVQNLINIIESVLGDKATKNGKIDLDNKDEVSVFTKMLDEVKKNNPNVEFDEKEISKILGLEKAESAKPSPYEPIEPNSTKIEKVVIYKTDRNDDGIVDDVYIDELNENGKTIKTMIDGNGNGKIDFIYVNEYDDKGNETKRIRMNGDGEVKRAIKYEYNEKGLKTKYSIDLDGDGKDDEIVTWQHNDKGDVTRCTHDIDGDGKIDIVTIYQYDKKGREIGYTEYDRDGVPVKVVDWSDWVKIKRKNFT